MARRPRPAGGQETNAEYHADFEHVGHSMLEVYRRSPRLYHALYVARTATPNPPTTDMVLGSITHCLALQPETFYDEFLVASGCYSRQGNRWDAAVARAAAKGKTAVLPDQVTHAQRMADAVRAHPLARRFLEAEGPVEQSIRWEDPSFSLRCKCKPDKLVLRGFDYLICVDVKTAGDPRPEEFGRQAGNLGYHRQAAWYPEGVAVEFGRPLSQIRFLFCVVGKDEPHDVWLYPVAPEDVSAGVAQNLEVLARLRASMDSGSWLGQYEGRTQEQLITLPIPDYATR
jgi:hypothetical protein